MSGPFSAWGQRYQAGAQFAIDRINADGGVMGRELELDYVDTESDPSEAITSYEEYAQSGVPATIGPVSSSVGIQLGPRANELQVPVILHYAKAKAVVGPDRRYQFRMNGAPGRSEWALYSGLVQSQGWDSVGAIFADYAYGQNQLAGFEEYVDPIEGVETHTQVAPLSASDFTSQLRQFPDGLGMLTGMGHPPGATTIVSQTFELGKNPENVLGASLPDAFWWGTIGERTTEGFQEIRMYDPSSSAYQDVALAFLEENEEYFSSYHVNGYVAVDVVRQAIENAESSESTDIHNALVSNTYDTLYAWDLDWNEFGEHSKFTVVVVGYESGGFEAYPDAPTHPVTVETLDPIKPAEIEDY